MSVPKPGALPAVRELRPGDVEYPARLLELHDPPSPLYTMGTIAMCDPPAVAIVGTRNASSYGLRVARAIASACARAGATVVSGLARGIDGASHEAALSAGGRTVAVLGTGLDLYYPRAHRALQQRIALEGVVLSELACGASGHRGSFPRRNRIIAALADVTVVVEAGEDSGALITSTEALELGRTVACVPNAIDLAGSRGSNALLKEGAAAILAPNDVLELLSLRATPTPGPMLDGDAAACWAAIEDGAADIRSIAAGSGLSLRVAAGAVTQLEIEGLVAVDGAGGVRTMLGRSATVSHEGAWKRR